MPFTPVTMKHLSAFLFPGLVILGMISCSPSEIRTRTDFGKGWKFTLTDSAMDAHNPGFDDSGWRILDLPHDWSIEGEFSPDHPATPGGGALPGGTGWYRKSFVISEADAGKRVYIDFDGVYRNSEVWINGEYLGKRPYGYSSFRYDLTPYLVAAPGENCLAVKVDNSLQPNSRWYSGSGIYRNVWLVTTGQVHVDHWGTQVVTPEVTEKESRVVVTTYVRNYLPEPQEGELTTDILGQDGKKQVRINTAFQVQPNAVATVQQEFKIDNPELWSIQTPVLYTAESTVTAGGEKTDRYLTPFGIRSFRFDRDSGFYLNEEPLKILGVCNHHDLGCLGAAVNKRALERQLELLKEMGVNAIRTSHNPPAPELLDLCDRMGFIVMDEAFDMWKKSKTKYDYHLDWDEWHKRDLQDLVLRDRNHPSVFMWSIGNEILEQWDSTGTIIARELAALVREIDNTRPVTAACNETRPINSIIQSGVLDLIGYNYHQQEFSAFRETFAQGAFIASETTSALATRGYYEMKSDSIRRWPVRWDIPFDGNPDHTCSSYDNCSTPWGSTHEESWKVIKEHDFLSGMFIWTGFDYLGEPTPYGWPSRSSYFGILDLAGFPKDAYYMYQSEWTRKPVLHLFPHWNWKVGDSIDMWVYHNYDEAELFLNGRSLGTKVKGADDLHVQWRVKYEPGEVKVVAKSGVYGEKEAVVRTAGEASRIELQADRTLLNTGGKDLGFVTVRVLDKDGNLVPNANNLIQFDISGAGSLEAVDNGDPVSHESFRSSSRKAFNGLCLLVVRAYGNQGKIEIRARSEGLEDGTGILEVR